MKFIRLSLASLVVVAVAAASAQGAATSTKTLIGTTGPGFTITLKTTAGKRVRKIKRGTYIFKIHDKSSIHNFHLLGQGISKKTTVAFVGTKTWKLRLKTGTYKYRCDVHRTIQHGSFKVVS